MLKELDNLRLIRQAPANTSNTCIIKTLTTNLEMDGIPSHAAYNAFFFFSTILHLDNLITTPPGSYLKSEDFISSLQTLFIHLHMQVRFPISRGKRNDRRKNARMGSVSFRVPHASEFSGCYSPKGQLTCVDCGLQQGAR